MPCIWGGGGAGQDQMFAAVILIDTLCEIFIFVKGCNLCNLVMCQFGKIQKFDHTKNGLWILANFFPSFICFSQCVCHNMYKEIIKGVMKIIVSCHHQVAKYKVAAREKER